VFGLWRRLQRSGNPFQGIHEVAPSADDAG
jgi:hypothetical protein